MRDVEFAPLTGSPARLASVAASSARAAAVLGDARGRLSLVCSALEGQRSGAVASARALLGDVGGRLDVCAGVLGAASSALREHAGELADRQREASLAISRRTDALDRERRLRAEADEARLALGNALGAEVGGVNLRALLAENGAADAREEAHAAEAQWRRARDAKRASSVSAASRLGGLTEVSALQAAAAAGTSVPAYEASWARGRHAAALAVTAGPGNGGGVVSDRADAAAGLRRALADAGRDPAFWAAFWSQIAPGELYVALGVRRADDELTASLGAGVRTWARTAAPDELEAFARAAITDLGASELGLEERAALAAALLAPTLPWLVHRSAADALAERRAARPDDLVDVVRLSSVTTAVAAGLALHPQAAFEHLAPGDAGPTGERARAWFGIAPPDGWPDGGEAVAGALAAAVLAGSRSPSRTDQARVALLVSHATQELPRGLLAGPVPPSDVASRRIARAYEPYVPVFGDTAASPANEHDPRPAGITDGFEPAEGLGTFDAVPPIVVQPELHPFALRDVIAATSQTPGAAGAWLGAADRYQDAMLGLAFGAAAPESISEKDRAALATETLRDAGAVAGAIQADRVAAAERLQAAQSVAVTAGTFAVSLATTKVPVSPVATTTATSGAGAMLPGMLPDHVGAARDHVLAIEPALRERYASRAFQVAVAHDIGSGVPLDDAVERNEPLAPRSDGAKLTFGGAYDQMSGLGRRLGENP